jgi:hypothetical protein
MEGPTRWRRAVTTALALTTLLALPAGAARAARTLGAVRGSSVSARRSRAHQVPDWVCDHPWRDGKRQVKRLIRCAARRWRVAGGPSKALSVAACESGFNPKAYNPAGYAGVFQQATKYWRGRARDYGFPRWSAFNGRANVIVSIRMAHEKGWGAWGCA